MYRWGLKGFVVTGVGVFFAFIFSCQLFAQNVISRNNIDDGKKRYLEVRVKTDKMIYAQDQNILITVYLKNKTEEPLDIIEPVRGKESLFFEIVLPGGKKDKLLAIYGLKPKTIRLYPKKRIKFTTKFTPEIKGNYMINVTYNGYANESISALPVSVFVVSGQKARTK